MKSVYLAVFYLVWGGLIHNSIQEHDWIGVGIFVTVAVMRMLTTWDQERCHESTAEENH